MKVKLVRIYFFGIISMTLFSYNDVTIVAQKVLADFLHQPVNTISCKKLTGGTEEDAVVQCIYQDTKYVIKLFNSHKFGYHEITWTRLASDLGIGPLLYYFDPHGKYMVIEFVEGSSLVPAIANTQKVIKCIAKHLATLHKAIATFGDNSDIFQRIESKYKKLQCSGELKNILEHGFSAIMIIKDQLHSLKVLPVSCHNDLNPGNIFVNNDYVTLIDWGDASLGNPYYDIAAFLVLNIVEKENEKFFFEQYSKQLNEAIYWQEEIQYYKRLVYFEFSINLLLGVQKLQNTLLSLNHIKYVNHINHYLLLLATKEANVDSMFLYSMAIASLHEMLKNKMS